MPVQAFWKIEIRNPDGKIVKVKKGKCNSFVLQFLQLLQVHCFVDTVSMKDTGNTSRAITGGAYDFQCNTGAGSASAGIVVGIGTNAVANTDYALQTLIAHGVGSGQLSYGAMSETAAQVVSSNVDYSLARTFQNLSGATITINEIALYMVGYIGGSNYSFCMLHDLATQAVNNLQTATVTYTLRTTA